MKLKIALGAGLAALGIALTSAAQAQGIYIGRPRVYMPPMVHHSVVPPSEILMLVRAAGLSPLTQPARTGPRYVLLASDRMGGQLRVVMSAYDGRILNVRPAHDPRFAYQSPRPPIGTPDRAPPQRYSAVPPPGLKDPPAAAHSSRSAPPPAAAHRPVPTSRIPLAGERRQASAPTASDLSPTPRSARTPLPRPRPAARSHTQTAAAPAEPPAATPSAPAAVRAQEPAANLAPTTGQGQRAAAPSKDVQLVPVAPLE